MTFYTAPTPVHAVGYGHVIVLVDTRHDRVHALTGPAAAWWNALARHGNPRDAAQAVGLAGGDADLLASELADAGFLVPTPTPLPWNPAIRGRQPGPSRGTTNAPVALSTPLRPPARWLLCALPAVALTCLANHAGPAATVITRHRTLATTAARTAHRRSWRQADADEIRQAVQAVRTVARYLPARFACFEEAIATHLALTVAARGVCWCHGTAPDPVRLHAWIEQTGTRHAPAEPPETRAYTAFTRISPHDPCEAIPITTETPLTDGVISLGPLRRDLVDTYLRWTNDPVVMRGNGRAEPETRENLAAGTDVRLAGDNLHFTVYDTTRTADDGGPLPVGTTSLSIDDYVGTAEFFIVLGEEGRSRGLAARATRLTLQAAFDHGLRSVHLAVLERNTAAIRAYTRAGFQHIGVRRACGWWDGEVCGEVLMDAVPADLAQVAPFPAPAAQPH